MADLIDLTGQRFGRWKVLERAPNAPHGMAMWKCECDCGNIKNVLSVNLRYGRTVSCGCYNSERAAIHCKDMAKHGMRDSRIYRIWNGMKNRCQLKTAHNYRNYGGRGITVCKEWQEFLPFYEWAMANGYRDDLTIDRIDVNGNYEPSNCRWATWSQQAQNKRKKGRKIE